MICGFDEYQLRPSPKEFLAKSVRQSVNNAKYKTEKPHVSHLAKLSQSIMHDYFKNTGTFEEGSWMHNNDPIGGKQCQPKNRQRRTYWKTHFFA